MLTRDFEVSGNPKCIFWRTCEEAVSKAVPENMQHVPLTSRNAGGTEAGGVGGSRADVPAGSWSWAAR